MFPLCVAHLETKPEFQGYIKQETDSVGTACDVSFFPLRDGSIHVKFYRYGVVTIRILACAL